MYMYVPITFSFTKAPMFRDAVDDVSGKPSLAEKNIKRNIFG